MNPLQIDAPPAEARPAAGPTSPRYALLDAARWISIYAVVWLHTVRSASLLPSTALSRFAVPFFVAACVFLVTEGVRRNPRRTFLEYAYSRFLRIYLPFLAWSAVYLGFKAVKSVSLPGQPNDYPGLAMLWTGAFYHLWFMPFILLVSLGTFLVAKSATKAKRLRWPLAAGCLVVGLALSLPGVPLAIAPGDGSWLYMAGALPAAFWTLGAGLACGGNPARTWGGAAWFGAAAPAFLGSMIWLGIFGRWAFVENLAGVSLLVIAVRPGPRFFERVPPVVYGVYLSHLLPIKTLEAIASRCGLLPGCLLDTAIFFASAMTATLLAWILYKSRWTRWLVA
jgi:hypothetical protein